MSKRSAKRILITGGAGFMGYHLARRLAMESDNQIVLVDNLSRGLLDSELRSLISESHVELISGDLTDQETFDQLDRDFDEVYHLAAMLGVKNVLDRPDQVLHVNVVSTLFLLQWFVNGGGNKLLFSSTSEVYAWTQQFHALPVPTPEDVPLALSDLSNPRSTYAGSKIMGELAVTQYCNLHEKPFTIVRPHNVYGPRMGMDHVIPEIYRRAFEGESPLAVYSADHTRAFCYVDDAVRGMIMALRKPEANGRTLNIGNDEEEVSIADLARRILRHIDGTIPIEPKTARNDPVVRRCPDVSRAREILGYKPRIRLDEGLNRMLPWYKNVFETGKT
jgi:UDP-glucose 4-epimerase